MLIQYIDNILSNQSIQKYYFNSDKFNLIGLERLEWFIKYLEWSFSKIKLKLDIN